MRQKMRSAELRAQRLPIPSHMSDEFADLVHRLLTLNPKARIAFDAFTICHHHRWIILRGDTILCGGQTIKMRCQAQIFLHNAAIFIGNVEMKQRPFMPLIGGHGKQDIGLGVVGCSDLALAFLRLQTGHILHWCFRTIVGMKLASASKHK